jgi:hypothetical protein
MSLSGTSRHFVDARQFGCFQTEVDGVHGLKPDVAPIGPMLSGGAAPGEVQLVDLEHAVRLQDHAGFSVRETPGSMWCANKHRAR